MGNFFAELKRRQMFRVAAAYAVVAWLLLQIINNVAPVLDLPPWVARAFLLALVVGFPIALLFVWMRDLAPSDRAAAPAKTGRLDWALIGSLIAVLLVLSYQQLSLSPGTVTAQQASVTATPASTQAPGISIVVLPFANVSGDASRDFFSDGMTDEISGALAKVRDLRVIARTSAFQFKGQNQDVRAVGQALGASHLIEGSVRQAGNRVRITAQLVRAGDGVQLWSENYDRELTDIFAIQEEIAQAIAGELRVPLGLPQGQNLVANRTADLDSYEQYLRARALYRARELDDAIKILEALVARDPGFAPGWGLLAQVYIQADLFDKVEAAAAEALRLDPKSAIALSALGDRSSFLARWTEGEDYFDRALAIDPNEPDVLHRYSARLGISGRIKDALIVREKLRTLEPFVPNFNSTTARFMVSVGQLGSAIAILEALPAGSAPNRNIYLARAYAAQGRYADAANALLAVGERNTYISRPSLETAARLLRSAPERAPSAGSPPALDRELNFVYAHIGALEHVLDGPERDLREHRQLGQQLDVFWDPVAAPLRKTERFRKFVRDAGLVDYWRAKGWADACRPVGSDDFACD